MREIKFRVWDTRSNEWIWNIGMQKDNVLVSGNEKIIFKVMQFTGLKDKNGKEIYEGDIVKYNKQNIEVRYFDNYGIFGLVGSNNYASKVIDESKPMGSRGSSTSYKPYVLSDFYQKRIEIIGNIHENPELLK